MLATGKCCRVRRSEGTILTNEKATYRMGKNMGPWCDLQGLNFQNTNSLYNSTTEKPPNQKMERRLNRHFSKADLHKHRSLFFEVSYWNFINFLWCCHICSIVHDPGSLPLLSICLKEQTPLAVFKGWFQWINAVLICPLGFGDDLRITIMLNWRQICSCHQGTVSPAWLADLLMDLCWEEIDF